MVYQQSWAELEIDICSNVKAAGLAIPLDIKFNAYGISDAAMPKLECFISSSWKQALSAELALETPGSTEEPEWRH